MSRWAKFAASSAALWGEYQAPPTLLAPGILASATFQATMGYEHALDAERA